MTSFAAVFADVNLNLDVGGALAQPGAAKSAPPVSETTPPPGEPMIYSRPGANDWTVRIQPRVWYVGAAGDLTLPGTPVGTRPADLADLNTDDPRVSPFVDLTIREPKSGWFFTVSGVGVSISESSVAPRATNIGGVAVAAGDALSTEVEWNTFQVYIGHPFTAFDFADKTRENNVSLSWIAGLRTHDQSFTVTGPGGTTNSSKFFIEGIVGLKLNIQLLERFSTEVDLAVGLSPFERSVFSTDIAVGFTYRPTDAVGLHIGYRLMNVDTETEEGVAKYHYDGSLAGLYAGCSIRF